MGSIDIIKLQCTVLSRAVNKSLQHQIIFSKILGKFFGNAENQTQGHWVQSENAIYCAMRPPRISNVCHRRRRRHRIIVQRIYVCFHGIKAHLINAGIIDKTQTIRFFKHQLCCCFESGNLIGGSVSSAALAIFGSPLEIERCHLYLPLLSCRLSWLFGSLILDHNKVF